MSTYTPPSSPAPYWRNLDHLPSFTTILNAQEETYPDPYLTTHTSAGHAYASPAPVYAALALFQYNEEGATTTTPPTTRMAQGQPSDDGSAGPVMSRQRAASSHRSASPAATAAGIVAERTVAVERGEALIQPQEFKNKYQKWSGVLRTARGGGPGELRCTVASSATMGHSAPRHIRGAPSGSAGCRGHRRTAGAIAPVPTSDS
ncbi:hypothetical protein BJV78DRAFT_1157299 [Lactifluus subvellereus]|nr:hypothetical protein BJV78DRAFT_1157299 [Lactifluus subvellereus]